MLNPTLFARVIKKYTGGYFFPDTVYVVISYFAAVRVETDSLTIITSLPKVIWEQGRVAAAVPGAGWHKGLRIRNVCLLYTSDAADE